MNKSTDDRRVRKTKKALREGLAELMMQKDLRSITVRELVDKVDIHRATFYSHYRDIYDLYEQMEEAVLKEIAAILDNSCLSYEKFFDILITYISENSRLCRMLMNKNGNHNFLSRASEFLEQKYLEVCVHETGTNITTEELKFLASYHINGCLGIISRWAETNFNYPKEKIISVIVKVDSNLDELMMN